MPATSLTVTNPLPAQFFRLAKSVTRSPVVLLMRIADGNLCSDCANSSFVPINPQPSTKIGVVANLFYFPLHAKLATAL